MKCKILLSIILITSLAACTDPNTTRPAVVSVSSDALKLTKGLEDCSYYSFDPGEGQRNLNIIRCSGEDVVSVNQLQSSGKSTIQSTTVVINGKTYIESQE